MTSRLGTGKSLTFSYSVGRQSCRGRLSPNICLWLQMQRQGVGGEQGAAGGQSLLSSAPGGGGGGGRRRRRTVRRPAAAGRVLVVFIRRRRGGRHLSLWCRGQPRLAGVCACRRQSFQVVAAGGAGVACLLSTVIATATAVPQDEHRHIIYK